MDDDETTKAVQLLETAMFHFSKANLQILMWRDKRKPDAEQIAAWQARRVEAARKVQEAIARLSKGAG